MNIPLIKNGDHVHIHGTEISESGIGIAKNVCNAGMNVVFCDTGKLGYYSFDRNLISLRLKGVD